MADGTLPVQSAAALRSVYAPKATAAWQLFNYAEGEATARGRNLLRVNLDETMVCLYPGRGRGAVFVPKEAIKQKLQAINSGAIPFSLSYSSSTLNQKLAKKSVGITEVVRHIWTTSGWKGFFPSYRATLMRNIPSAMVRFTVYEELKHLGSVKSDDNLRILLVGGAASALSSACTTPIDVVKTRLATGTLPKGTKVSAAIAQIAKKEGVKGLYSGVQERALWSALFGGVGLTCFERCKTLAIKLTDEQRKSDGV